MFNYNNWDIYQLFYVQRKNICCIEVGQTGHHHLHSHTLDTQVWILAMCGVCQHLLAWKKEKEVKQPSSEAGPPNVPKRLDGHELNSHSVLKLPHRCPSPSLPISTLGYTTIYRDYSSLHEMSCSMSGLLSWMPLSALRCIYDKTKTRAKEQMAEVLPDVLPEKFTPLKTRKVEEEKSTQLFVFYVFGEVGDKDPILFFSLDWLVWETLKHNLLALTCSLKKALSTGIRLSWQGQLRLTLSPFMCLYHSGWCLFTASLFVMLPPKEDVCRFTLA